MISDEGRDSDVGGEWVVGAGEGVNEGAGDAVDADENSGSVADSGGMMVGGDETDGVKVRGERSG